MWFWENSRCLPCDILSQIWKVNHNPSLSHNPNLNTVPNTIPYPTLTLNPRDPISTRATLISMIKKGIHVISVGDNIDAFTHLEDFMDKVIAGEEYVKAMVLSTRGFPF